jgi:hypothetical protein
VIAVFTKYDQFKLDVDMKLEDQHYDPDTNFEDAVENIFNQHYLANLKGHPPYIRLESEDFVNHLKVYHTNFCPIGMHKPGQRCTRLIELTTNALSRPRPGSFSLTVGS